VIDGARLRHALGLTGGDGYEISTPGDRTEAIARSCSPAEVKPIGLGARAFAPPRSRPLPLRPQTSTPPRRRSRRPAVEHRQGAPRARRLSGAAVIHKQIAEGAPRKRVGLLPDGKAIAREEQRSPSPARSWAGDLSGFAPTLGPRVAMGYVERPILANGPRSSFWCAASPCRPRSCPCLRQTRPTTADKDF